MTYYIIEHPTRGTLRDLEETASGRVGRFSTTGSRNDPERTMQFPTVERAIMALHALGQRSNGCVVRASTGKERGMADWASSWPQVFPEDRRA